MRVLIINSMFFHEAYRKSADELGAMPGIDLTMLTADAWVTNGRLEESAPVLAGSPYNAVTGVAHWKGKENRSFYRTGLLRAFKMSRPEVILLMEEPFSLFAVQVLLMRELLAKDVPVVFFTWNNLSLSEFDYRPTIWYRSVVRWTLPKMQYALTANTDAVEVLRRNKFHGPMKSIGYGVDTSTFVRTSESETALRRATLNIPQDATVIGYVGRLLEMKGIDLLLAAFARLRQSSPDKTYILLLVGSGPAETALLEQAKQLGIYSSIRHISAVTQGDVPKYMSLIDMLVLPSRRVGMWTEQFGRVIVEAMTMRVPVIGSSSGAIPEVICDAGYIFEENNSDDLFEKLLTVDRLSAQEKNELLDRGELRAGERYSWRGFAQACFDAVHEAKQRSSVGY